MTEAMKQLEAELHELSAREMETTEKVDVLNKLSEQLVFDDPKRSLDLCVEAYELAKRLTYPLGIAYSLGLMGYSYYMVSDHDAALPKFLEALSFAEQAGDEENQAQILSGLAAVNLSLGNYEQALGHSFKALRLIQKIGNRYMEAWCLNGIAAGYHDLGDYERALDYHRRSLELFEGLGERKGEERARIGEARALTGIGTVYQSMGDLESACEYHTRSLVLFQETGNKIGEARAFNDLGSIFGQLNEFDKALHFHLEALKIREEIGNKQAQSTTLISLGKLYIQWGDAPKALEVLHRALTLAMEIKAKPRIYQANLALSEAYSLQGDYSDALEHYKIYQEVKEKVSGDQANARVKNLQIGFEVEKAESEAEIARLRNIELKEKNEQLERLIKELKETQSELVQSKKMAALGSLVAGLVHEMNTPLAVIRSAADVSVRAATNINMIIENGGTEEEIKRDKKLRRSLEALARNNEVTVAGSERIKRIVEDLKSFARLDEARFQKADLHQGLDTTLALVEHDLHGQIEVVKDYGDIPEIACFAGELNQVFMNLISNAAESITNKGKITIRTSTENKKVRVEIEDTGIGIPQDQMQGLFDPSFTAKGLRVKAGMGLFTCYNIVRKHHGDIKVKSEVGTGSTFAVVLPTDLEERLEAELAEEARN